MKDNYKIYCFMDLESILLSLMVLMKAFGRKEWLMDKVNQLTSMGICIVDPFRKILGMAMEKIPIATEKSIKDIL